MRYIKVVTILFQLITFLSATNFTIGNLQSLPTYEKYVLKAVVDGVEQASIDIEYRVVNRGSDSAFWEVKGKMPINGIEIEEWYKIGLKDLNVIESKRTQKYKRGSTKQENFYDVNTKSDEPGVFLISSFNSLMYILRTFPFEADTKELRVRLAQQTRKNFAVKVRNRGETTIKNPTFGEIAVYEADISLAVPVIGAFLPNIKYYFKQDDAHTLVAMKGSFGGSGKKIQVNLVKHEVKE